LVDAARHLGYKFLGISNSNIQIEILGTTKDIELLHIFEFNSDRKRMSMLVKENGILKLYMKGADSKIKERLNFTIYQPFLKYLEEKIDLLSKKGYRVLCFAMRVITIEEYEEFLKKLEITKTLSNREAEICKKKNY
jgi:P-type E1-E2 ATPase